MKTEVKKKISQPDIFQSQTNIDCDMKMGVPGLYIKPKNQLYAGYAFYVFYILSLYPFYCEMEWNSKNGFAPKRVRTIC